MVAVIGDVHGCFGTLKELYFNIRRKYNDIPVYCVGDLVDRGKHSFEVMEFINSEQILFTPGNHDYMFSHFFTYPKSAFAKAWAYNGNESTLLSYKNNEAQLFKHIDFIQNAPLFYNTDDCFISHAGISSQYEKILNIDGANLNGNLESLFTYIQSDYQSEKGVLWNRDTIMNIGKMQIVGHAKHKDVTYKDESNVVYIDTGAYVGNKLSAVVVNKSNIIDILHVKTDLDDII